jgi:hypothetical protein
MTHDLFLAEATRSWAAASKSRASAGGRKKSLRGAEARATPPPILVKSAR